jgi:hypothetical protein
LKIPYDYSTFFQTLASIVDEAHVSIQGGVYRFASMDPSHTTMIVVEYAPPNGTPLDDVLLNNPQGVKTGFIAAAMKQRMVLEFTPGGLVATSDTDPGYEARQKYVTCEAPPDSQNLKKVWTGEGVQTGLIDLSRISRVDKGFSHDLDHITLTVAEGEKDIQFAFTSEDTGFKYESRVGSLEQEAATPVKLHLSWGLLGLVAELQNFEVRLKSDFPAVFQKTKSTDSGNATLTYYVAPRIEAEEPESTPPAPGPVAPSVGVEENNEEGGEHDEDEETTEEESQKETEEPNAESVEPIPAQ